MSNLPVSRYPSSARVAAPSTLSEVMLASRVNRAVQQTPASAHVRAVQARAEAAVSTAKIKSAAQVAREAAVSAAALTNYANTLAGGDAILREELRHFENVFRAGAGEVLADLFSDYCQEGWR